MGTTGWKQQTETLAIFTSKSNLYGNKYSYLAYGSGAQKTWSQNNHWNPGGPNEGNVGGAFTSTRDSYSGDDKIYHCEYGGPGYNQATRSSVYDGNICAKAKTFTTSTLGLWPVAPTPSTALQLSGYGSTAIARCLPTNPVAGLSNFLGELKRDGIPHAIGDSFISFQRIGRNASRPLQNGRKRKVLKSRDPRKLGDEYLGLEFAWRPFVSDLTKFATVAKDSEKILKQYHRNSGRPMHRRYKFPTETTKVVEVSSNSALPIFLGGIASSAYINSVGSILTKTTTTSVDRWFSGCFKYYLDVGSDAMSKMHLATQEANKLLGVRITPELVWDLTPWSWAADWLGNIGDIAHNVSAFSADGLVMQYGYIMEHKTSTIDYSVTGFTYKNPYSRGPLTLHQSFTRESKIRQAATPFGFGLNTATFSGRQWAIIAALGISRKPRAL